MGVVTDKNLELFADGLRDSLARGMTYDEYVKLSDEEKKGLIIITDAETEIPTSGVPIGTVISFLGMNAPSGYLMCDGSIHQISQYPALANFFKGEFGSIGYFGGDGTSTFAVPDLRNLFLRGYHGDAEAKLSGDIGKVQESTRINTFSSIAPGTVNMAVDESGTSFVENVDAYHGGTYERLRVSSPYAVKSTISSATSMNYSVHPINMAVNFCIKAEASVEGSGPAATPIPKEDENNERIIAYTNAGKPIYERRLTGFKMVESYNTNADYDISDWKIDNLLTFTAHMTNSSSGQMTMLPLYIYRTSDAAFNQFSVFYLVDGRIRAQNLSNEKYNSTWFGSEMTITLTFTKTTD